MRALALVGHQRHAVAARVGDPRRRRRRRSSAAPRDRRVLEAGLARSSASKRGSPGGTTSPRPCRRTIRGGPSNAQSMTHDAAVLAQVGDRLRAAADDVEVGDRVRRRARAATPIGPFGETLTWPSPAERRGGDEEQRLARDPVAQVVVDLARRCAPWSNRSGQPSSTSAAISRSVAAASRSVTRMWRSSPHCSPAATLIRRRPRCSASSRPECAVGGQPHERRGGRRERERRAVQRGGEPARARVRPRRGGGRSRRRRARAPTARGLRGRVDREIDGVGARPSRAGRARSRRGSRPSRGPWRSCGRPAGSAARRPGRRRPRRARGTRRAPRRAGPSTRSGTRARSARSSSADEPAPVGSLGEQSAIARVAGRSRRPTRAAEVGTAAVPGSTGRPPARSASRGSGCQPGHATSSSPPPRSSACAGRLQQLAGAVADHDLRGRDAVARAAIASRSARAPGPGSALSARRSANVAALTVSGAAARARSWRRGRAARPRRARAGARSSACSRSSARELVRRQLLELPVVVEEAPHRGANVGPGPRDQQEPERRTRARRRSRWP